MRRWLAVLSLLAVAACTPKVPPQPPAPPDDPCAVCPPGTTCVTIPRTGMPPLVECVPDKPPQACEPLRQEGGKLMRAGKPYKLFGAIPCWDPLEKDHGGWPGVSKAWVDYSMAKGANAFHVRLGPFLRDKPNVTWRGTGGMNEDFGPYVDDDAAKGFYQPWWDRARSGVGYVDSMGSITELDLVDGWNIKHDLWGDHLSPWSEADVRAAGKTLTDMHRAWLRKVVETFGPFCGVIWQDGNEVGLIPGYQPAWTFEMRDYVRQLEQEVGGGVVHMFGSNSQHEEVNASPKIDYIQVHTKGPIDSPEHGKPVMNNEHNPPASPSVERAYFCELQGKGSAWWYWRGAHSQADMEATLNAFGVDCSKPVETSCPAPLPPKEKLSFRIQCNKPGGFCDATPVIEKDLAYCESIGMGTIGGQPRATCPIRNECPGFQCEERLTCEAYVMGRTDPLWRSDGTIHRNGWLARCESCSYLEACAADGTHCGRVTF